MSDKIYCPICKVPATYTSRNTDDDRFYHCPNCGDYDIPTACVRILKNGVKQDELAEIMHTRKPGYMPGFRINEHGTLVFIHPSPPDTRKK